MLVKHHAMKEYGRMEVSLYAFVTFTLRKLGGPQSRCGHKAEVKLSVLGLISKSFIAQSIVLDAVLTH